MIVYAWKLMLVYYQGVSGLGIVFARFIRIIGVRGVILEPEVLNFWLTDLLTTRFNLLNL